MTLPAASFCVFLMARSFAAVSGETETAMQTRFTAFVLPARFAFPRIEAEIFAFVAELFGACFQGSFFMGKMFFGVDFPRRTGFIPLRRLLCL